MVEKFSVLISVYHRERGDFLRQSLTSVFEQSVPPTEVVLVKDGPLTIELDAVVDEFARRYDTLNIVILSQNVGLGEALNQGLKHCKYDLVARMDSDDICICDRFERQLTAFAEQPGVSLVGGWIDEFIDKPTKIESCRKVPELHDDIVRLARSKCPFNHMTVMFRKSMVERAGNYQSFYLFEDYWLWVRMLHSGAKSFNLQLSLVMVRGGSNMFARRGGLKYAMSEIRLFKQFRSLGFISTATLLKNVCIRFPIRMMPNIMRSFVYNKLLR